jgi:phage protein U
MTGYTSMMLGDFAFKALGFGYQGLKRKVNTPWVEIPVGQTLNQQQWTGPTSDEVTINGVLFPLEFGGQEQLDGLIEAQLDGAELMLVTGDAGRGDIRGIFTIQSVEEDKAYIDRRGQAGKNAYVIALKRKADTAELATGVIVNRAVTLLNDLFR